MVDTDVSAPELYQAWSALSLDERIEGLNSFDEKRLRSSFEI